MARKLQIIGNVAEQLGVVSRDEFESAVADGKAVAITVDNENIPSHSSKAIYDLIQAGKVVYLCLPDNTYVRCISSTETVAKFKNSRVTSIETADGKTYTAKRFKLYSIEDATEGTIFKQDAIDIPEKEYIDDQFVSKNALETAIGNIETALDGIIAIQNELIGGDAV